jgi:hypothetical protein
MSLIAALDYSLDAADSDGISVSQTPLAAGDLTITGALASGGVATLGAGKVQRRVIITSVGNDSARTFTIEGTNSAGTPISEELTGANAAAAQSARDYQTVTRIGVDAATAGAVTAGTNGVGATPWIPLDRARNPFAVGFGVTVDGTVTYRPQHTFDDVQRLNAPPPDVFRNDGTAFDDPGATTSQDGNIAFPVAAFRVQINSGTGILRIRVIQAGIRGG